ncbi:GntR family transcriptional regulator [Hymenobacter properus]|uniref:GntR family transcriptional regulator n=1 Tax=Hymenobacter properus TaxID=2791026 RepID=A0A931BIM8_9BACT|nr:GntR family transcriptional regulator [Hymenobacter properus]MBF9142057.1 GntR family transcriptional regulator [Hymenobacter properus]MBR7720864.1 GntR family transcriptional regulator [Microvirga sp. SRT04]
MEFKDNEAIYLQIAGYVSELILRGKWPPDSKIPSVRELAGDLQVNPNTVMRTYELLQGQEVLYNKRGIGFFVAQAAVQQVQAARRERFLSQELPEVFGTMLLLGIGLPEVQRRYEEFKTTQSLPAVS